MLQLHAPQLIVSKHQKHHLAEMLNDLPTTQVQLGGEEEVKISTQTAAASANNARTLTAYSAIHTAWPSHCVNLAAAQLRDTSSRQASNKSSHPSVHQSEAVLAARAAGDAAWHAVTFADDKLLTCTLRQTRAAQSIVKRVCYSSAHNTSAASQLPYQCATVLEYTPV
jgi:hypothetical protein